MLFDFRTLLATLVSVSLISVSQSSLVHRAKLVRVYRESERSQLADGTKFEKYAEKGKDLPPLPLGDEEEANDLNDPRIGHLNKKGEVAVPVDKNGNVLPGYEYLLKPITITVDFDEKDANGNPIAVFDTLQKPQVKDPYDPYLSLKNSHQHQNPVEPKPEFVPNDMPLNGEEYDDVQVDPQEPLPEVPDLPRPDYSDSGELDEEMKVLDEEEEDVKEDEKNKIEVIVPSTLIEQPIVTDNVEEKNRSGQAEDNVPEEQNGEESDKSIDIPKNRVDEVAEEKREEEEESIGLTEEDVQKLAEDLRKDVFEHIMNKASEFTDSEDDQDLPVDPNSIVPEPEVPALPVLPVESGESGESEESKESEETNDSAAEAAAVAADEVSDGVVLPDQSLSDEEIASNAAESLIPEQPAAPVDPVPNVRGSRIGAGVQPDSASKYNVILQILTVTLALLFL